MRTDEDLFEDLLEGNMDGFDILYKRYSNALFRYICGYLRSREEAEEVFQEAFLEVIDSPTFVRQKGSFRSWIYRIARNKSLNRLKAKQRKEKYSRLLGFSLKQEPTPASLVETQHTATAFEKAVEQLPTKLADVYKLRTSGMAYEEIAHALDLPLGTVKSRIHSIVKHLQRDLHQWIEN